MYPISPFSANGEMGMEIGFQKMLTCTCTGQTKVFDEYTFPIRKIFDV